MKAASIFIAAIFFCGTGTAQSGAHEILERSKQFYASRPTGQVKLHTIFKSSIAETVSANEMNIAWSREKDLTAMWNGKNKSVQILDGKKYYSLNNEEQSYLDLSSIKEDAQMLRRKYPFYDNGFINALEKREWKVVMIDGKYQLKNNGTEVYIDTNDFSISRFRDEEINRNGMQLSEWRLLEQHYAGNIDQTELPLQLAKLKKFTKVSIKDLPQNPEWTGKNIRYMLNDTLFNKGKYILVDVFYQSCMPCIASFPKLKALQKDLGSELIINGLDPMSEDSASMDKFIKRYGLNYQVITGEKAFITNNLLNPAHYYPLYVFMDERGTVIDVQEGYNEKFFERIRNHIGSRSQ